MEISTFWIVLGSCLIPLLVAYLAVELDEHDAYKGGWHKQTHA